MIKQVVATRLSKNKSKRCPERKISKRCLERYQVEVTFDGEIEAPPSVYPSLPDALSLVVLLGAQRGVTEILNQKSNAAVSCALDSERGLRVVLEEASGVEGPHLLLFCSFFASWWRDWIASFADE